MGRWENEVVNDRKRTNGGFPADTGCAKRGWITSAMVVSSRVIGCGFGRLGDGFALGKLLYKPLVCLFWPDTELRVQIVE
jgi:hypothetical protein